jgi:hypothetical protein
MTARPAGRDGMRHARSILGAAAIAGALTLTAGAAPAGAASTTPPPKGWLTGWPVPDAKFIGRYRLTSSRITNPAVKSGKTTGELTLFMQTTFASSAPVPAGIISLHTAHTTTIVYLTDLDHKQMTLVSLVHGGSFVAPVTGRFVVAKLAHGTITGTLTDAKLAKRILTFKRFSKRTQ